MVHIAKKKYFDCHHGFPYNCSTTGCLADDHINADLVLQKTVFPPSVNLSTLSQSPKKPQPLTFLYVWCIKLKLTSLFLCLQNSTVQRSTPVPGPWGILWGVLRECGVFVCVYIMVDQSESGSKRSQSCSR